LTFTLPTSTCVPTSIWDSSEISDFEVAIQEALALYREIYGSMLVAVYVTGSAHRGEAVIGLSDLDMYAFLNAAPPSTTHDVLHACSQTRLAPWLRADVGLPAAASPDVLERLAGTRPFASEQERALYARFAFTLRYDARRVHGDEVLTGRPAPTPDVAFARDYLRGPLENVRSVSGGQEHPEFPLPRAPIPRLRKLGRLAVLCGACLLMGRGQFRSFRGADVLPPLIGQVPCWSPFLRDTARCYAWVTTDAPSYEAYLPTLARFAEWCREELASA
jgi:hypothetical protein